MIYINFPGKVLLRLLTVLLAGFLILVLLSFNIPGKPFDRDAGIAGTTWNKAIKAFTIRAIPHFKLSKAIMDKYGASWDRRIVLKFSIRNITSENPRVDLLSYLATSQEDHAEGEMADRLEPINEYLPLDNYPEVILGNNYIHLIQLNSIINNLPDQNYDHIRFIPMVSDKYPGHIVFGIKIYGANNTPLNPYGSKTAMVIDEQTNPSPPAPPDGY